MDGKRRFLLAAIAALAVLASADISHAQQEILAMPRLGGYTAASDNSIGAGGVGRPLVSPYTNLPMINV